MFRANFYLLSPLSLLLVLAVAASPSAVAQTLDESNYDQLVPAGKETDAIYGDYALKNKAAKAIIALPALTRNANMTVRNVGGCLIDFAPTDHESDQLSAFYPGRQRFRYTQGGTDGHSATVIAPGTESKPKAAVRYELKPDKPVIEITTLFINTTKKDWTIRLEDSLRADGRNNEFVKTPNGRRTVYYFNDIYWQQAYGVRAEGYEIQCNSNGRESFLTYRPLGDIPKVLKPGESFTFKRQIIVARDLAQVLAIADRETGDLSLRRCRIGLTDASDHPIAHAMIQITDENKLVRGYVHTDTEGNVLLELPDGHYSIRVRIAGVSLLPRETAITVTDRKTDHILSCLDYRPGSVVAKITDGSGNPIPAKVEFLGTEKTPTPNWGPDTAEHFVKNLAYTENGQFEVPLPSGIYNVIVSHGPEYDAVFTQLTIEPGKATELIASLKHSVETPGWISSDFHSHSSPSGDNTSSQRGRVLNLAAEQIDFAPCTEHNRISSYQPHIDELGLQPFLGTVSGMELTGSPLRINHQNVFPMIEVPRTQDGGGPLTDADPELQIERITLWDDRSEKLVQQNHPDIGWLFHDKNGDGSPDEGYSRSFRLMDVMEVHPIDRILNLAKFDVRGGKPIGNHTMLNWLQLLNQGHRIYGVVNADSHYNYHGSGWIRNWIQCSTDQPAEIDPMEIVRASEQGRLIMSNGPFLEATFQPTAGEPKVVSGQDLFAPKGRVTVNVKIQCANWLDIDSVFLLINGKVSDEFNFTREKNGDLFADGVVKFEQSIDITLDDDSHLIVVCGHRVAKLGDVMGPIGGSQYPTALTNPVFVDIDGDGFTPNKDTLGFPLPVKFAPPK